MSLVDARTPGAQEHEATRLRPLPGDTRPSPAAPGGDTAPSVDTDLTRQPHADAAAIPLRTSEPREPHTGWILGNRYRLERELGAGGMGVVFRAADLQVPGEFFAIKVLKPKLQGHPELVRVLREEARKTRVLSHPNIVGAYSISSDADGDYMLMEYLEGETLQKLLDEEFGRGVPLLRAWPYITDICAGLAYAHDHNIIHSDLKPSNVFVTTCSKVKLLDFGIARVARGPIRGFDAGAYGAATESYASCEMLEGGTPDVRDDVYALGCVVYEMLSGKHPFGRRSATQARALNLQPTPLASLSRRQNSALAKALRFEREQRTASVEEFQSRLQPRSGVAAHWPTILLGALVAAVIAGVVLVARKSLEAAPGAVPAAQPVPEAALAVVRSLSQKAAALGIDPDDARLRGGLRALEDAQVSIRAGASILASQYLEKAQESLQEALRLSPRIATVGSTAAEIETALQLCRAETENSPDCTATSFADEKSRKVSFAPFTLDATPATNAEFDRFARDTGYITAAERSHGLYAAAEKQVLLPGWSWRTLLNKELPPDAEPADLPVRGIDYAAAKAYCAWRGARLPSEDEWEYVARGPQRKVFPWGERAEDAPEPQSRRLWPALQAPQTGAFGNRGLGGQLWEWTDGGDAKPILRGPSYLVNLTFYQRLATRERENPGHARIDTGLRCATSSEAWPDAAAGSGAAR